MLHYDDLMERCAELRQELNSLKIEQEKLLVRFATFQQLSMQVMATDHRLEALLEEFASIAEATIAIRLEASTYLANFGRRPIPTHMAIDEWDS